MFEFVTFESDSFRRFWDDLERLRDDLIEETRIFLQIFCKLIFHEFISKSLIGV